MSDKRRNKKQSRTDRLLGCTVENDRVLFEMWLPVEFVRVVEDLEGSAMVADEVLARVMLRAVERYCCDVPSRAEARRPTDDEAQLRLM